MPLNIIRDDISKVSADAIVNTANPLVAVGAGVDEAIYNAAGAEQLLAERAKIGPMLPGQAAATPAFALNAKYIIHTVGPAWEGGNYGEREDVASCYRESLRIADELHCESIAFPLISTGTYGFPKDEALRIAINEISSFLFGHDMNVTLVVYDKKAFVISSKAFGEVKSYIDEQDVKRPRRSTQIEGMRRRQIMAARRRRERESLLEKEMATGPVEEDKTVDASVPMMSYSVDLFEEMPDDIEDVIRQKAETFQQMLFRLIDRKGMTDPEVYKKANLDRKLFSKIRSNEDYKPTKRTALAFAVALELNLDETTDLLQRAGLALSPSSRFDRIVGYCINHKIYNIYEINTYLFDYDEELLVG